MLLLLPLLLLCLTEGDIVGDFHSIQRIIKGIRNSGGSILLSFVNI